MPVGEASVQLVTVGDPGNAPDTVVMNNGTSGYGSVPYVYQMGKYDVTVAQYCQFLDAVAASDAYGLYNSYMAPMSGNPLYTGSMPTVGIVQSGTPGGYTYSVSYGAGAWSPYVAYNSSLYPSALAAASDAPVFDVTWGDAARFCNWLQNGQPTGAEGPGTTETGAYTLDGDTTQYLETRNIGATCFLPSENEWYKAAFYKGGGTNAGYWAYPVTSEYGPSNVLSATGTNNANYSGYGPSFPDPTNYRFLNRVRG
jgi:formylglycine-generating enzyme required for sulfatase activity